MKKSRSDDIAKPAKKIQVFHDIMTDDDIKNLLDDAQTHEALAWLTEPKGPTRSLGEATGHAASVSLVESFLEAGATNIWVLGPIDSADEMENSGRLVVQLPDAASSRKAVLGLASEIAQELGFDPEEDLGQRYLLVMLD